MSDLEVWLIIILVIGVIASNLAVLKYSAKFKMTQFGKPHKKRPHSGGTKPDDMKLDDKKSGDNKPDTKKPAEKHDNDKTQDE